MKRTITTMLLGLALLLVTTSFASGQSQTDQILKQAQKLANERLQEIENTDEDANEATKNESARAMVKALVMRAFNERQERQLKQIEEVLKKLNATKKRLLERSKNIDAIVDAKVNELMTPASNRWDSGGMPKMLTTIAAGDILAVYIPEVIPNPSASNANSVTVLPNGRPITGMPVPVRQDGTIQLPFVKPINVAGLTVTECVSAVRDVFTDIIKPDRLSVLIDHIPAADLRGNASSNAGVVSSSSQKNQERASELLAEAQLRSRLAEVELKLVQTQSDIELRDLDRNKQMEILKTMEQAAKSGLTSKGELLEGTQAYERAEQLYRAAIAKREALEKQLEMEEAAVEAFRSQR
ncbi:MAG: polysaccharide biosynthesis/export family protein [Planctomycetota bacterium]